MKDLGAVAAALAGIVVVAACSQAPSPAARKAPGLPDDLAPAGSASVAPTASAEVSETQVALASFRPLLARPELAPVATQLEAGRFAAAAMLLARLLKKVPEEATAHDGVPLSSWYFLLGLLEAAAGHDGAARLAYERSLKLGSPLADHARARLARLELARGKPAAARKLLEAIDEELPDEAAVRLLQADVALTLGDRKAALAAYRKHLEGGRFPHDWVRVSLELAAALDRPNTPEPELVEAVTLTRRVRLFATRSPASQARARQLEHSILGRLSPAARKQHGHASDEERLAQVSALYRWGRRGDVVDEVDAFLKGRSAGWDGVACEAALLRAKAIGKRGKWGAAADALKDPIRHCKVGVMEAEDALRPRLLYVAGKYAAADGRHPEAMRWFAQIEQEAPTHRLADDARWRRAKSALRLGDEARYTSLLSTIVDDYPKGDVAVDGALELAIRRMEKADWSGAANVLDRAAARVADDDVARGTEYSGRERYFRARAWAETGEKARALDEYAAIVREAPLSYYMLHAYSRLEAADGKRAHALVDEARKKSEAEPFTFEAAPALGKPGFARALELLRVSEVDLAKDELRRLGVLRQGAAPQLLWNVAALYAQAGSAKLSHRVARGLLTDWLERWPAGPWKKAWEISFPRPHQQLVERSAKKESVPPELVYGVMREESAFDARAESPAKAYGLMQLILPTARYISRGTGLPHSRRALLRPSVNIALGTRALARFRSKFPYNRHLAVPGYNAGPGRPARWVRQRPDMAFDLWVELIPFRETQRYTKRVLASRAAYSYLYYAPGDADAAFKLPLVVR